MTSRACVRQALPARSVCIASYASASDGLGERRRAVNTMSNPAPSSAVFSQCQAANRPGCALTQRLLLVVEDFEREPGVQLGVVDAPPLELSVLIVLDQVVIWVAGKGKGIESEGIDRRQPQ